MVMTSSTTYPQSNGQSEHAVQMIKQGPEKPSRVAMNPFDVAVLLEHTTGRSSILSSTTADEQDAQRSTAVS